VGCPGRAGIKFFYPVYRGAGYFPLADPHGADHDPGSQDPVGGPDTGVYIRLWKRKFYVSADSLDRVTLSGESLGADPAQPVPPVR